MPPDDSRNDSLTAAAGVRVGHWTDAEAATGCTVVLLPEGARAAVQLRGRAHGTRELTMLRPGMLVDAVDAVVLSGGSAFGLATADGVMRWLEQRGRGFPTPFGPVPIVPAAIHYDLGIGRADLRPGAAEGREACEAASESPVEMGCVGAGTGATIGKMAGYDRAMKSGIGSAAVRLAGGAVVGALVVVNALGDVIDPENGRIIAGARDPQKGFLNTAEVVMSGAAVPPVGGSNTTLAVVATDADLDRSALDVIAEQAHDGLARCIRPVHTMMDGDAVFAVSTGRVRDDVHRVAVAASEAVVRAVLAAVRAATSMHGIPALADLELTN